MPVRLPRPTGMNRLAQHPASDVLAVNGADSVARQMLNKVPEVTLYIWVIKVLCTTVGETGSDYLSDNVGLGLTKTTFITGGLLFATVVFSLRARRKTPAR